MPVKLREMPLKTLLLTNAEMANLSVSF